MLVTNDLLYSYINCQYKAYLKGKQQLGSTSEYQILYTKLKQIQTDNFEKQVSAIRKTFSKIISFDNSFHREGIALNVKFINENIDIVLDGIEFLGKNIFIPIFITPFEKVTRLDKLFLALQSTYIQTNFNIQANLCKIIFGQNLKETKFKISSFSKAIKKISGDLTKLYLNSNAPIFYKNQHCLICEFQNLCLEKLIERDDLSLLTSLKPKEILQKNNRGVFSVKQLSYSFRPKKNPYRKRKFVPELKALAIRDNKTFIQEVPNLKEVETEVFLDFEGIPDRNSNYLIGLIIRTGNIDKEHSFWANSKEDENYIFVQIIELLKPLKSFTIYHYGSYEIQALKNISKSLSVEYQDCLKILIANSFNLLNVFTHNIYPPTYSNSLKEIGRFLKFEWSDKDASGLQSIIWRYNWEHTQNECLKDKLITYNLEDCRALIKVKDWICIIPKSGDENFENAQKFKKESIYKWSNEKFIIDELVQINSFAYFNYQREKILLKTYPKIARQQKLIHSQKLKRNKNLKPNKIIELSRPTECSVCKGLTFNKHDKHKRIVIDLKLSKSGIKRVITLFYGSRYKCRKCSKNVTPKEIIGHSKYGRTLTCWIINQVMHYKVSYNNISQQLKESFEINFFPSAISRIKSQFSNFYEATYNEIINNVKKGPLIHIDETIFHIRKQSCYIWVFANVDTVFYLFKPTREAEFLKELLVNFRGVLISDFYAGYDSMSCPKQRCLIHLIRNLNDDLVKHQLNSELKIIVLNFSKLLTGIMDTVNRFGLKKRNLTKHKKSVEFFFKSLSKMDFETEICSKWQKRFNSIKNELFTFLNYDGVPWNNNNAETAIKAFAVYRKQTDGLPTQKGIEEYLTLLSIQQTCKYRGINFFDFLKSGETSIEKFSMK